MEISVGIRTHMEAYIHMEIFVGIRTLESAIFTQKFHMEILLLVD